MNVEGMSILIDMPTSQYGTLTVDGREYLVHVTHLYKVPVPGGPDNELHYYIEIKMSGILPLEDE